MKKPKFLNSVTDWFLVATAVVLFGLEMLAAAGIVPFITTETVEISVYQIWVPVVLGILMGHFFPLPWRRENVKALLFGMFIGVGAYVAWYIATPAESLLAALDILAEYLYAFFLGGYVLGSTFFGRAPHRLEQ